VQLTQGKLLAVHIDLIHMIQCANLPQNVPRRREATGKKVFKIAVSRVAESSKIFTSLQKFITIFDFFRSAYISDLKIAPGRYT
jgi:hypothetical protein